MRQVEQDREERLSSAPNVRLIYEPQTRPGSTREVVRVVRKALDRTLQTVLSRSMRAFGLDGCAGRNNIQQSVVGAATGGGRKCK